MFIIDSVVRKKHSVLEPIPIAGKQIHVSFRMLQFRYKLDHQIFINDTL